MTFTELRMEPPLLAQENSTILRHSNVLLCSVRNVAGFDGKASNLRRITCWKRALQFFIQLKVELSFFPLRKSLLRPLGPSILIHVAPHDCG
jgi:hypothetical protein